MNGIELGGGNGTGEGIGRALVSFGSSGLPVPAARASVSREENR